MTKRSGGAFVALLLACTSFRAMAAPRSLRAGASRVEITDLAPPAQPLFGKYAHEHLFIRAIVLDTGSALIGLDKADMDEPVWQQAPKSVAAELNGPVENIIMSATHSYACMPTFGPKGPKIPGVPSRSPPRLWRQCGRRKPRCSQRGLASARAFPIST